MSHGDDDLRAAHVRAIAACRHDICACGEVTPDGVVIGDPQGPIPQTLYRDVLDMAWDQTTWDRLDTAPEETR